MAREQFSGHLDILLLAALRSGPLHGYAIIDHIRSTSAQRFDYAEGTVYPALHRLADAGLLASDWSDADGRKRRVYALTAKGEAALAAERTEWKRFAGGVQAVLGWSA
jgi:DNA-binding PadR family transcriptional regulator